MQRRTLLQWLAAVPAILPFESIRLFDPTMTQELTTKPSVTFFYGFSDVANSPSDMAAKNRIKGFICPSDPEKATTRYAYWWVYVQGSGGGADNFGICRSIRSRSASFSRI